ncbi:MAG: hypothetical protein JXB10_19530 [Pirellulales bacterium]|nr:hypothetical protein [Pirellulales bacterium]
MNVRIFSLSVACLLTAASGLFFVGGGRLSAAVPEYVGVLALVDNDEAVAELGLVPEQKAKLRQLIDRREDEAVDLAMQLRDKSAAERAEKLEAFRRESEAKGLKLLSSEQRAKIEKIRLRHLGMASLTERGVAEKLNLSAEQKEQIADLLKHREQGLARADEKTAYAIRMETERKLATILNPQQKSDWESLVAANGRSPNATPPSSTSKPEVSTPGAGDGPAHTAKNDAAHATEDISAHEVRAPGSKSPSPSTNTPSSFLGAENGPARSSENSAGSEGPSPAAGGKHPEKIRFNFHFAPWKEVIEWFAEQAGYSLTLGSTPSGTFNYFSNQEYTPAEAIDLLNWQLMTKGYTLIRRGDMLMLINLGDGVPPDMIDVITPEQLDGRGQYELVTVVFNLDKLSPEDAKNEIGSMISERGKVVVLDKSRQVQVTETGGRLRAIRAMIQRVEDPAGFSSRRTKYLALKYLPTEDALTTIRQLFGMGEDQNATGDGSLRIVPDVEGRRLLVNAAPGMMKRLEETLQVIDAPPPGAEGVGGLWSTPQFEVFPIVGADSQSVLKVMQTLLAGKPDVRLDLDPKTGNLVAYARRTELDTIRAVLDQMQRDARRVEVIRLRTLDPQLAILAINKLFEGDSNKNALPQVAADPTSRQLMIRGTDAQIGQIRDLLNKLGEVREGESAAARGNVRMLSLSPRAVGAVMDRMKEIWPTLRSNEIQVVTPSAASSTLRMSSPALRRLPLSSQQSGTRGSEQDEQDRRPWDRFRRWRDRDDFRPPWGFPPGPMGPPGPPANEDSSTRANWAPIRLVADQKTVSEQHADQRAGSDPATSKNDKEGMGWRPVSKGEAVPKPTDEKAPPSSNPPPIILTYTPEGVMIASEDLEALDEFENLLNALTGGITGGGPELTVFYLKNAGAAAVAETIDQIFGGGTLTQRNSNSGGGSLLGNLAGAALGGDSGGLVGSLLGLDGDGGTIAPSGLIRITPDARLNALIVQANPLDLDTIDQLCQLLDQPESPEEVHIASKARIIPVQYTKAENIAEILKQVYQDRLVSGSGGPARQPNPMEIIQALRGNRGRRGGTQNQGTAEEASKMSIGVDARNNSLVIAAPNDLFQEVEELVAKLDVVSEDSAETMEVVTLRNVSPESVQNALSAIIGEGVQIGTTGASGGRSPTTFGRRDESSRQMDNFRRRMEFFRRFQQGGFGGPGGGRGGSGNRGGGR